MKKCLNCNETYDENFGACPYCSAKDSVLTDNDNPTQATTNNDSNPKNAKGTYNDSYQSLQNDDNSIKTNDNPDNKTEDKKRFMPILAVIAVVIVVVVLLFATGIINSTEPQQSDTGSSEYEFTTLPDGSIIYPTTPNGDIILPTTPDGNVILPTNSDGNVVYPTNPDGSLTMLTNPDGSPIYVTTPNGEISTNPNGSPVLAPTKPASNSSEGNNNASNSSALSESENSSNSNQNNNNSQSSSSDSSTPSDKKVTINGNKYNVGDKIKVDVMFTESKKTMLAINAGFYFDSDLLAYVDDSLEFPNLGSALPNTNLEDRLIFNASGIKPFDFSTEKLLVSCTFTVLDSNITSGTIDFKIAQILRSKGDNDFDDIPESEYKVSVTLK